MNIRISRFFSLVVVLSILTSCSSQPTSAESQSTTEQIIETETTSETFTNNVTIDTDSNSSKNQKNDNTVSVFNMCFEVKPEWSLDIERNNSLNIDLDNDNSILIGYGELNDSYSNADEYYDSITKKNKDKSIIENEKGTKLVKTLRENGDIENVIVFDKGCITYADFPENNVYGFEPNDFIDSIMFCEYTEPKVQPVSNEDSVSDSYSTFFRGNIWFNYPRLWEHETLDDQGQELFWDYSNDDYIVLHMCMYDSSLKDQNPEDYIAYLLTAANNQSYSEPTIKYLDGVQMPFVVAGKPDEEYATVFTCFKDGYTHSFIVGGNEDLNGEELFKEFCNNSIVFN